MRTIKALTTTFFLISATAPAFAGNGVIEYDALDGAEAGGDSFATGGNLLMDRVQVNPGGYVNEISVFVKLQTADAGSFRIVGGKVTEGSEKPRNIVTIATIPDSSLVPGKFVLLTLKRHRYIHVAMDKPYYIGIASVPGSPSSVVLGRTVAPQVLSRSGVVMGALFYNKNGVQPNSNGPYQIKGTVNKGH